MRILNKLALPSSVVLMLSGSAGANQPVLTKFVGLDSEIGTPNSLAVGVSNTGRLAGYSALYGYDETTGMSYDPTPHGFLGISKNSFVDIGVLGTDPGAFVFPRGETLTTGMNNLDHIVAYGYDSTHTPPRSALFWSQSGAFGLGSGLHLLPGLSSGAVAQALGVNDMGVVVGSSQPLTYDPNNQSQEDRPTKWTISGGTISVQDLDPGQTRPGGTGRAVNNLGQIVGTIKLAEPNQFLHEGFLYLPSAAYGLPAGLNILQQVDPDNPFLQVYADPRAINESGQIVGLTNEFGTPMPAIWLPSPALGLPAGITIFDNPAYWQDAITKLDALFFNYAQFSSINESGVIVGTANFTVHQPGPHGGFFVAEDFAFILRNGQIRLLDDLKPASTPWKRLFGPVTINDNNVIAVNGVDARGQVFAVKYELDAAAACPNGIIRQPVSGTFCQNQEAHLSVWASEGGATDPLTYQWRRGGVPLSNGPTSWGSVISGSNTLKLVISNAQLMDAASYDVIVSNSCGTLTSSPASINITPTVTISSQPVSTSSCPAGPANFSVVGDTGFPAWEIEDPFNPGLWSTMNDEMFFAADPNDTVGIRLTATNWDTANLTVSNIRGTPFPTTLKFRCGFETTLDCPLSYSAEATLRICPGDFDCSGSIQVADIFAFLNAWFSQFNVCTSGCSADINGDNTVSVSDIFAFLNLWFAGFGHPCP